MVNVVLGEVQCRVSDFCCQFGIGGRKVCKGQHVEYELFIHSFYSILMKANKAETLCIIVIINNKGVKISHMDNNLHTKYVVWIYN